MLGLGLLQLVQEPGAAVDKRAERPIFGVQWPASRVGRTVCRFPRCPQPPHQPNQSKKVPRMASDTLWPGMGTGLPLASKRPTRGPSTHAPARAATPPTMCTAPEEGQASRRELVRTENHTLKYLGKPTLQRPATPSAQLAMHRARECLAGLKRAHGGNESCNAGRHRARGGLLDAAHPSQQSRSPRCQRAATCRFRRPAGQRGSWQRIVNRPVGQQGS